MLEGLILAYVAAENSFGISFVGSSLENFRKLFSTENKVVPHRRRRGLNLADPADLANNGGVAGPVICGTPIVTDSASGRR